MKNLIRKHFTQIPNDLINDTEISSQARFLFVYLCSKPDSWKYWTKDIENALGVSKDTRLKYMRELKEKGWLEIKQMLKADGTFGANEIQLYPQPNFSATVENEPQPNLSAADNLRSGKTSLHSNTNKSVINNKKVIKKGQPAQKAQSAAPKEQPDLFGKKEKINLSKSVLFKNSAFYDTEIFKKKLKKLADLNIDLEYYRRQIDNWSEAQNKKRTSNGWLATCRTWVERDKEKNAIRFIKSDAEIMQGDADIHEYLKM